MKNIKFSQFVGRQLSRLKAGQSIIQLFFATITALGIAYIAFPKIETLALIFLFPIGFFGSFLLGYLLDKSNVITMDKQKSIEMTHRYLNVADFKMNEFYLLITKTLFKELNLSTKNLELAYSEYIKNWSLPKSKQKK